MNLEIEAYEGELRELRKAAEMALEYFEDAYGIDVIEFEIKEALRQALAQPEHGNSNPNYPISESNTSLDKIVEQAIQGHASTRDAIRWAMQQEREACAKVCDSISEDQWALYKGRPPYTRKELERASDYTQGKSDGAEVCAAAIRAREENLPVKSYCGGKPNYCTPEVTGEVTGDVDAVNISAERVDETAKSKHEPVAWFVQYEYRHEFLWRKPNELEQKTALEINPLYTAPPKREWVGLTDEERFLNDCRSPEEIEYAIAIEAKLKEKNT